jgi:hypothetical protein
MSVLDAVVRSGMRSGTCAGADEPSAAWSPAATVPDVRLVSGQRPQD